MALPLAALLAIGGGLQEATTGREQQTRDAQSKATAYRMMAYLKGLNPESMQVRQADPFGGAVQGGMTGYGLQSQIARSKRDDAVTEALTGKEQESLAPTGVAPGSDGRILETSYIDPQNPPQDAFLPKHNRYSLSNEPYITPYGAQRARMNTFLLGG